MAESQPPETSRRHGFAIPTGTSFAFIPRSRYRAWGLTAGSDQTWPAKGSRGLIGPVAISRVPVARPQPRAEGGESHDVVTWTGHRFSARRCSAIHGGMQS